MRYKFIFDVRICGFRPTLSSAKKYSVSPYHLTGQKFIMTIAAQNTVIPIAGVMDSFQNAIRLVAAVCTRVQ